MDKDIKKETIDVKGMHCATCAVTIGKKIGRMDGVEECDVNYGTERVQLKYDPTKVSITDMNKQIQKLGYSLTPPAQDKLESMDMESMSGMDHSAHLGINQTKEEKIQEVQKQKNKILIVLPIALAVFLFMITNIIHLYVKAFPAIHIADSLLNPVEFILASFILFWAGQQFIMGAYRFVRYGSADMDALVGIGTITAFIYSSVILLFPQVQIALHLTSQTYFDTTIIVLGFILFGKYLEASSKLKTGEAIEKLLNLQAKTAFVQRDGKEIELPIEQVVVGDIIIVKPGGKIPIDGVIVEGKSSIDESMITGESIPIDKTVGDTVIGGTINKQGSFRFKTTKIGSETLLAHIIKMVEDAQGSRAPIQRLADQIASIFTPVVLIIASASGCSDFDSREAATLRISSSLRLLCVNISVTSGVPLVIVPVLSMTTVFTL